MGQRKGTCIYCGGYGKITNDHTPPKGIFPKPLPSNLITVPACSKCNHAAHGDDEYFRLVLTMRHDTSELECVKPVLETVFRSLKRQDKQGFARAFLGTYKRRPVVTPSGLFIGYQPTYDVDRHRLLRVVARTAKGLFFKHRKRALPLNYDSTAIDKEEYPRLDPNVQSTMRAVLQLMEDQNPRVFGQGVFKYWRHFLEEDENVSVWLMVFYQRVPFFAMTGPRLPASIATGQS